MHFSKFRLHSKKFELIFILFFLIALLPGSSYGTDYQLGDIPLDWNTYEKNLRLPPGDRLERAHPSSYDARDDNIVTPPKNQGSCGSCWAFASTGGLESHILKAYGGSPTGINLSEQQLLDCNSYGYSCSGGSSNAMRYWESTGPVNETCYPYTAVRGTCSSSCTELTYRVTSWYTVWPSE